MKNAESRCKKTDLMRLAYQELGTDASNSEVERWIRKTYGRDLTKYDVRDFKRSKVGKSIDVTNINENPHHTPYPVPSNLYHAAINLYGQEWGRLFCYLATSAQSPILLSQEVLASCHARGYTAIQLGKKPSLSLAAELMERIGECKFNPVITDYVPNKACRTVINMDYGALINVIQAPSSSFVDLYTGKELAQLAPQPALPSPVQEVEALRKRLLGQNLDYAHLLEHRFQAMFGIIADIENPQERVKQLAILNRIRLSPAPQYSAVEKSSRLYTTGASFQNLTREARKAAFSGFKQFDLKQAQLNIISVLWDAPHLLQYFAGQSIWTVLRAETQLDKDTLKKGVYTLIFGGTYNNAVTNMAEVCGLRNWEVLNKISACRFFRDLETASKRYTQTIRDTMSCLDAFGNELVPEGKKLTDKEIRSIKGVQAQSYEVKVMLPVLNYLLDSGFNCWLFLHDGFVSDQNSHLIHGELIRITESVGTSMGLTMTLDMEVLP